MLLCSIRFFLVLAATLCVNALGWATLQTSRNSRTSSISKKARQSTFQLRASSNLIDSIDTTTLLKNTVLKGKKLKLLYKASRDGWNYKEFHRRVDCGLPTLICAKPKADGGVPFLNFGGDNKSSNDIVGGFNPFGWISTDDYRNTNNAFVFRKDGTTGELFVCKKLGSDGAIYDFGNGGPSFGVEALIIPLNGAKLQSVKGATSILGNDYSKLNPVTNTRTSEESSSRSSGIAARRSGVSIDGNSLFGAKNRAELVELEAYVDASQSIQIQGDIAAGIEDGFSWGGYGR